MLPTQLGDMVNGGEETERIMAISAVGTYLPTVQEFLNHWTQANLELGAAPIVLSDGYTLANFSADRTALENAVLGLQPVDNIRTNTAADRDIKKNALRARLTQFRAIVSGQMAESRYVRSLPKLPNPTANEAAYLAPFNSMASLWKKINASPPKGFTGPLLLQGGYSQANLTADIAALRAAYAAANDATANSRSAREERDLLLPNLRARMKQYRQVAKGRLPASSPLAGTIPAYSPPPGSTPAPVKVFGVWDAALGQAVLTWEASSNPALDSYSIRTAPGPVYKAAEEVVVASVPTAQNTFATDTGLAAPGSVALFRVYVVLSTGNERGSATVKISRP